LKFRAMGNFALDHAPALEGLNGENGEHEPTESM
jgi:hypothetical protein